MAKIRQFTNTNTDTVPVETQALNSGQLSFLRKICGAVSDLHQPGVWAEIFGQNISGIHRSRIDNDRKILQ